MRYLSDGQHYYAFLNEGQILHVNLSGPLVNLIDNIPNEDLFAVSEKEFMDAFNNVMIDLNSFLERVE